MPAPRRRPLACREPPSSPPSLGGYTVVCKIHCCIPKSSPNLGMMESVPVERLTPERRRALTRTALVEAAAEVFARRGFHAASLDEIAETAGFTRGAIYSNFSGKEDLLLAVLDQYTDRQLEAFGEVL